MFSLSVSLSGKGLVIKIVYLIEQSCSLEYVPVKHQILKDIMTIMLVIDLVSCDQIGLLLYVEILGCSVSILPML